MYFVSTCFMSWNIACKLWNPVNVVSRSCLILYHQISSIWICISFCIWIYRSCTSSLGKLDLLGSLVNASFIAIFQITFTLFLVMTWVLMNQLSILVLCDLQVKFWKFLVYFSWLSCEWGCKKFLWFDMDYLWT